MGERRARLVTHTVARVCAITANRAWTCRGRRYITIHPYRLGNEPSHIALATTVGRLGNTMSVKVISKWGLDPEFEHFMENVPERLGRPVEFYTDRRI